MKPFTLHLGDCIEVMRGMADNSVDAIVCDPPYGLSKEPDMAEVLRHWLAGDDYQHKGSGFMGKTWDSFVPGPAVWREALRVLKPGGHLLAFFGSRTYDIGTLAIRLAGFEVRDQTMWVYSTGFPKSQNISKAIDKQAGAEREVIGYDASRARPNRQYEAGAIGNIGGSGKVSDRSDNGATITAPATDAALQWDGWGTALKPAHEPICVARKPLAKGLTVAANVLQFGTGALNIDGCRVETADDLNGGRYSDNKAGCDGNSYGAGINLRSVNSYTQPVGRWPANLIHDGSDEVVALFPDSTGSGPARRLNRGTREGEGWGMADEPGELRDAGTGSAARFFYCPKASRADRGPGNTHPTLKPTALMQYLCRLVTPPGGLVLDPFMGSGSTGKACVREGFRFTGIDMTAEYVEIARARIEHEHACVTAANTPPPPPPQLDLFATPTREGDANAA